jgi:5-methylthioadenosine/S-adenosylhomocysteine deaminase
MPGAYSLSGLSIVTPEAVIASGALQIDQARIARLGSMARFDVRFGEGFAAFPALVNVHDHFNGNYLPRVGPPPGEFYLNWSNWDRDFKASELLTVERPKIPVDDRYELSAYKNIFSGVVTANDHFGHEFNEPFIARMPMRLIGNYTLAHECSSFDLKWGEGIEIEHERARRQNWPFITHLEEGFDPESQDGIGVLERLGCLDDHCVLIHCIGFSDEDVEKVARAGATVGWCPASNLFMFNLTCKVRPLLRAGANVAIGTDSTATGSVNLFEEMRFARATYRRLYGEDLAPRTILDMVTRNPARAFRMERDIGSLEPGRLADVLVIRQTVADPYESLLAARTEDIELLIQDGTPILGAAEREELFTARGARASRVKVRGREMLVKGDPAGLLERVRRAVGFRKVLEFMPLDA